MLGGVEPLGGLAPLSHVPRIRVEPGEPERARLVALHVAAHEVPVARAPCEPVGVHGALAAVAPRGRVAERDAAPAAEHDLRRGRQPSGVGIEADPERPGVGTGEHSALGAGQQLSSGLFGRAVVAAARARGEEQRGQLLGCEGDLGKVVLVLGDRVGLG